MDEIFSSMFQPVEELIGPSTCSKDQAFNLHGPYGDIQLLLSWSFCPRIGHQQEPGTSRRGIRPLVPASQETVRNLDEIRKSAEKVNQ